MAAKNNRRTKVELQTEIIAKDVRIAQLEKALLESLDTQTRYMHEQFQFQGAIKNCASEIGGCLHRRSQGGPRRRNRNQRDV